MRLRWTPPAAEDLESIKNYLEEHYPEFADVYATNWTGPQREFQE
jgi:plasmid stabilization system protein ParE